MKQQVFINLPVDDLNRAVHFFTQLGYTFNPQFTNDNATCMVVSDEIFVMLLVKPFFQTFTNKKIADAQQTTEVLICLSCENREQVDTLVRKAVVAGAKTPREPQDHGFMYSHGYEDLDGHIWELMYMDPNHTH